MKTTETIDKLNDVIDFVSHHKKAKQSRRLSGREKENLVKIQNLENALIIALEILANQVEWRD